MTVRAYQDALPGLGSVCSDALAASHAHAEGFLTRIDVMEMKADDAAVVAADGAGAAGLLDKDAP